jgi:hypothetical protein
MAADKLAELTHARWRRAADRQMDTPIPVSWRQPAREVSGAPAVAAGLVTCLPAEVYAGLRGERLVILGGAGAGKSGAMLLILLGALERRAGLPGDQRERMPVPVWLRLSQWEPGRAALRDWVAAVIRLDYPELRARGYGPGAIGALVSAGRVALYLDGLDEVPPAERARVLARIEAEAASLPVVVTCRTAEYPGSGVPGSRVIELLPVGAAAAAGYLLNGPSGPGSAGRTLVGEYLAAHPGSLPAQALDSPLTLSLARDACAGGDAAALVDPARFPTAAALREHLAGQLLVSAYLKERQRARATRWLAWAAFHMAASPDLNWWDIPLWIPRRQLQTTFNLIMLSLGSLAISLPMVIASNLVLMSIPFTLFVFTGYYLSPTLHRDMQIKTARPPEAMAPHWPGWRGLRPLLLGLLPWATAALVFIFCKAWIVPVAGPSATPRGAYRAERRASVIYGLGQVLSFVPITVIVLLIGAAVGRWLASLLYCALATGLIVGLRKGPVALLKMAELAVLVTRRDRVRFLHLLEQALDRQVLRQSGASYQFRFPPLQARLAAVHAQALADQYQERAARRAAARRIGWYARPAAFLTSRRISRISLDLTCGGGITAAAVMAVSCFSPGGLSWGVILTRACLTGIGVGISAFVMARLARPALAAVGRLLGAVSQSTRRSRAVMVASTAVVVAALSVGAGQGVGKVAAAAVTRGLPIVSVAVAGSRAALLAHRRLRSTRIGGLRYVGDLLLAVTGGVIVVLLDRDLAAGAAGLLFPVIVWLAVTVWRRMTGSGRLAVRAGADIALALLLGADLVLLAVWAANLLGLREEEVAVLRGVLERAGSIIDLPWWTWAALFALLAGTSLAFARWPARLAAGIRWTERLRVVPSADVGRRLLTSAHIGLLVIALVGLAAPAAVRPALHDRLRARYAVALRQELDDIGERAAYLDIRREFAPGNGAHPPVLVLDEIISSIHRVSSLPPGDDGASGTEQDLARRVGQIQGATLTLPDPPPVLSNMTAATELDRIGAPVGDAVDLDGRLGKLDAEEDEDKTVSRQLDQAAELAVAAVASTLQIPHLAAKEIVQVVQEYLSGLVEGSPLKHVFSAWAEHLTSPAAPFPDEIVEPDAQQLRTAALAALTSEQAQAGDGDSGPADQARLRALRQQAAAAAVDLVNQARYLQEGTGPCRGCTQPSSRSGQQDNQEPGNEDEPHVIIDP